MTDAVLDEGIVAARLSREQYKCNFADLHPALDPHEAHVEADRCYFCFDAPCQTACPTEIDIPMFIRQIGTGNRLGAAKTIFDQNILGAMCARVCPTETLCEEACVRNTAEAKPVRIGELQRYATDLALEDNAQFYERAPETGKQIAIVGAGPAGLAAAHGLARLGHAVTVFDAREKPGGLNEYGIATYKATENIAQREVDYILGVGGITVQSGKALGRDFTLDELEERFDAVFLGLGLQGVNSLGAADREAEGLEAEGLEAEGLEDAIAFIARLRQTEDVKQMPIGRRVVVIGGGMTAIDAAIQAKLLGAEEVTICYRRGAGNMKASTFEQDLAASHGVQIRHWLSPQSVVTENGKVRGITLGYTELDGGELVETGETLTLAADQIFKAIGQKLDVELVAAAGLEMMRGRIAVDEGFKTSRQKVWAGGDCVLGGEDLTVTATAHGRDAAQAIHQFLAG